ncbi:hypothetical protein K9L67_01840 [Candidatus Woesearchaeota archaeon]|nr:hypothetical protein [Candidatus Woesearchaeota archaeon]MCF7900946.1 hypothetical protein [Candidatus Woesearchaeota archaeon]MCF8013608.1 hypothetical protein [Candidatus Woesearchaeota archaeon]
MTEQKIRFVSFLIPIIDGEIWLGQRGTEPFKEYYGAIGGKVDESTSLDNNYAQIIKKPGNHKEYSVLDKIALEKQKEFFKKAAVREFAEEIFSKQQFPNDFSNKDITNILKLGVIEDTLLNQPDYRNDCIFYLANINRKDFTPSLREIKNFQPLSKINYSEIFPITKIALIDLKYKSKKFKLNFLNDYPKEIFEKIPDYEIDRPRKTSMLGANLYYETFGYLN